MKRIMNNLYWKLFVFFWLAIISMILSSVWFTSELAGRVSANYRTQNLLKDSANAATIIYQTSRFSGLQMWLRYLKEQHGIDAFLTQQVSENQLIFLGDPLAKQPEERTKHERMIRDRLKHLPLPVQQSLREGDVLISSPIIAKNKVYRLILSRPPITKPLFATNWQTLLIRLLFATLISGLICYILSRYLTKPLAILQNAARKIGAGHLNIRVLPKMGNRHDEIYELASEFDLMTSELERSISSQQRLLQYISHELRSPLARLRIAAELLTKRIGPIPELDRISLESERLNALIHEILTLARLDIPKKNTEFISVDLLPLLNDIIKDVNFEIQDPSSQVVLKSKKPYQIQGNPNLLRSVFENIIRNAIKHAKTKVDVHLSESSQLHRKGVLVTIRDYGPGIPKKHLSKLFDPFYRVDTTHKGYGLGLTIAKKTIELHGGTINVTNHPQGGLFFNIFLPYSIKHITGI